ncbi:DUF2167 domain-containing protein [Pendulispora brunnea]|uniref:DUF2167 domain-containing protein n=1 Tax=Pendulispora brunnea TaxID=2905690 RepID=A0ABZ2KHI7_9BACT
MVQMIFVALLALVAAWPRAAFAEESGEKPPVQWQAGPRDIDLGHDLKLALPEADVYLPPGPAAKMLEKNGSFHNENLLGIVASKDEEAQWFVTIRYEAEGYIKDDEKIDADELLSAIREGTEEGNKERLEKGFKAWHVDGWSEPPQYDKSLHHLVWALSVSDDEGKSVNFNTRILGRRGYVAINLVTAPELLAGYKPEAAALLKATTFSSAARYEAFDAKTDKVAEYGLAGLVLGGAGLGAAKLVKIGLLAKFWKVIIAALIAGKKAIVLVLAGIAAFVKKLFSRKNEPANG